MRFIKILLIIIAILCFIGLTFMMFFLISEGSSNNALLTYVYLAIVYIGAAFNVAYHIKSYPFYHKQKTMKVHKKVSLIFWLGAIVVNSAFLWLFAFGIYDYILLTRSGIPYTLFDTILILGFVTLGVLGFIEIFHLKNRIKRRKVEHNTENDINSIGSKIV